MRHHDLPTTATNHEMAAEPLAIITDEHCPEPGTVGLIV
jgi:hypothetical protein